MNDSLRKRIGLVGLGSHGTQAVIPGIGNSSEWELAAIADRNPASLRKFPDLRGYTSIEKMLQEEALDALYIATLPDSHCAIATAGLRAGLHVICEKPMAAHANECALMLNAAEEAGREIIVMFENRFLPYNQKIRQWIREGAIGRVEAIHIQSFGKHPTQQPRRTFLLNAAGCLDCGIHMLDLARYWNDGACWETIHALGTWFDEAVERPPHLGVLARLDNGVMVTFEDSFSYGYRVESLPFNYVKSSLAIVGTHGIIADNQNNGRVIELVSELRCEQIPVEVSYHSHEIPKVLDTFASHLRGEATPESLASLATGRDGYEAQRIVDETNRQAVATRFPFKTPAV